MNYLTIYQHNVRSHRMFREVRAALKEMLEPEAAVIASMATQSVLACAGYEQNTPPGPFELTETADGPLLSLTVTPKCEFLQHNPLDRPGALSLTTAFYREFSYPDVSYMKNMLPAYLEVLERMPELHQLTKGEFEFKDLQGTPLDTLHAFCTKGVMPEQLFVSGYIQFRDILMEGYCLEARPYIAEPYLRNLDGHLFMYGMLYSNVVFNDDGVDEGNFIRNVLKFMQEYQSITAETQSELRKKASLFIQRHDPTYCGVMFHLRHP